MLLVEFLGLVLALAYGIKFFFTGEDIDLLYCLVFLALTKD